MKIFTYIVLVLGIVLIGVNVSMLNLEDLFNGDSLVALIGILAVLCAIVILLIFNLSKSIENQLKNHS
ncbi:hypothetical protein B0A78_05985 [Flavobacterium columnare NBRC 100251 = ATCC 23463]|uniref:Uncharacterized protein n=2 Tax=Flavobacterium columnare TaxID=996 RepID=G8X5L6_FLACA|nr:hypothetical protein [Flavobacterium columnare]AEW86860.1 hypothetical protein FCOL_10265 [Flavobacterium columnare ATCC 49512]AMO20774.1 hypothetical protein UN65_10915 [Flavobacterium columnare]ANO47286.1 hypothetical protein Pf1_01829 [Flavobacterium columnare]APT22049.1 hypothetical protein BU993_05005 [Flavobacterium columnare]AUX18759.1 hypothetical protein AQ623_11070 [Flavobacterium columnare]